jgi:DNA (cytosine-5)-methyltransferase 1
MIAGGPPCQGFSSAGRRREDDPRNSLIEAYLTLIGLIQPQVVLLENVQWIAVDFRGHADGAQRTNYAAGLKSRLSVDYNVFSTVVNTADYGVPQSRKRYILIALRKSTGLTIDGLARLIDASRTTHLRRKGLVVPVSSQAAISDMEKERNGTRPSTENHGFNELRYEGPLTSYQRLMRDGSKAQPSDLRLANHRPEIVERFGQLISQCETEGRLNTSIGKDIREQFGLSKHALRVLDPDRPAPTVTSMPDDLLHYSEPRTLTVRENARLQGFPDWFVFRGKYTSGGHRRRQEVPRFTQVANAVPPPLAEILGEALSKLCEQASAHERRRQRLSG